MVVVKRFPYVLAVIAIVFLFSISLTAKAMPQSTHLLLNGEKQTRTVSLDCTRFDQDVSSPQEGWIWRHADLTLMLDNCSIQTQDTVALVLPAGATMIFLDGTTNLISSDYEGNEDVYGVICRGALCIQGGDVGDGVLTIKSGNSTRYQIGKSIGIFAEDLKIQKVAIYIYAGRAAESCAMLVNNAEFFGACDLFLSARGDFGTCRVLDSNGLTLGEMVNLRVAIAGNVDTVLGGGIYAHESFTMIDGSIYMNSTQNGSLVSYDVILNPDLDDEDSVVTELTGEMISKLSVIDGRGTGMYICGAAVTIAANAPAENMVFKRWEADSASNIIDPSSAITTFIMSKKPDTVRAVFKHSFTSVSPNTLELVGKTEKSYCSGEGDIITVNAPFSLDSVILKCSGMVYGVDYIISGYSPNGNQFNMRINDLRAGVKITFLQSSKQKGQWLKIKLIPPRGWTVQKNASELLYFIEPGMNDVVTKVVLDSCLSVKSLEDSAYIVNIDGYSRHGYFNPFQCIYYPNISNPFALGWKDDLIDKNKRIVCLYTGERVGHKEVYSINSDSIPEMNQGPFMNKPAFSLLVYDRFAKKDGRPQKPRRSAIVVNKAKNGMRIQSNVKLYDSRSINTQRKNGIGFGAYGDCDTYLGGQIIFSYKDKQSSIEVKNAPVGAIILSAPLNCKVDSVIELPKERKTLLIVSGDFLGSAPKAFVEYKKDLKINVLRCLVDHSKKLKENSHYFNDLTSTWRKVHIFVPLLPKGTDTSFQPKVVIDNGIGYGGAILPNFNIKE